MYISVWSCSKSGMLYASTRVYSSRICHTCTWSQIVLSFQLAAVSHADKLPTKCFLPPSNEGLYHGDYFSCLLPADIDYCIQSNIQYFEMFEFDMWIIKYGQEHIKECRMEREHVVQLVELSVQEVAGSIPSGPNVTTERMRAYFQNY